MNQLQRDLRRSIAEKLDNKLSQWISDSFDLYEMADLSPQLAVSDVLTVLLWHTSIHLSKAKVPEHEIPNLIRKAMGELP